MSVPGITSQAVGSPFFDPWSPIDPIRERMPEKVRQPAFDKDTQETAQTLAFLLEECFEDYAVQQSKNTHRPKLEAPQVDLQALSAAHEEIGQLISKVAKKETSENAKEDLNLSDILLFTMYKDCVTTQQEYRNEDTKLTFDTMQRRQEANKKIKEEYFNQKDDLIKRAKTSKILGWVSWLFTGVMIAAGIASIALTIATAGAALPAALATIGAALPTVLAAVGSTAAVASGTVTITKGILDHQNKKTTGALEEIKLERHMNSQKISTAMTEMNQSYEAVLDLWKQMSQILNNWYAASLNH
ncbi:MAG: hypothetical protein K940chlam7_01889 [Chlamydiae bacterium]|nr:hypothetical protein [Chlamydiota bacterium]